MRLLLLVMISSLVNNQCVSAKSNKTILCNPEFKFEYDISSFNVWSSTNSTLLTDEKNRNQLNVRHKGKYFGSMIVKTGLAYDWNSLRRKESYNRLYYDDYVSYRQTYFPTTDYEVSKEFITVNGLTLTLKRFLVESCGMEGKSSSYYYTLDLDTTFRDFSRLHAHFTSLHVTENYLPHVRKYALDLTTFFQGFKLAPTSEILQGKHTATSVEIQKRYDSYVEDILKIFRKRIIKSYKRDTTGFTSYEQSAGLIPLETILNFAKTDRLDLLADTVVAIRHHFANRELKLFLETYNQYDYSNERRYQYLGLLAQNRFPYDYFLNVRDDGAKENALDTLFKLIQLQAADIDEVFNYWQSSYAGLYYSSLIEPLDTTNNQLKLLTSRPYAQFVPELMRKVYAEELKSPDPDFQPYVELINAPAIKSFLLFNPARYHQSELLLATFRKNETHWNLEIDTLDASMRLRGKERLRQWGDYFIFEQQDSIYLLDVSVSPVSMTPLPFTGDSLDQYIFYSKEIAFNRNGGFIEPQRCQFQRDMVDPESLEQIWNQLVRDRKIFMNTAYNPCYTCIDLNHGDSLIPPMSYYNYARMAVSTDDCCYRSGYIIRDLDGDGGKELFCYTVSNGELKQWTCYWMKEGRLTFMEPIAAKALIEQDGDCINLKAFSKIGRKTKQPATPR